MPEGDTLFRTAAVLREVLSGREVVEARGRAGGPPLAHVIGSRVERVEARGKHLLIDFDRGLTLHTHLRMHGSWHRYRSGERWRRSPSRAVAVIEVPSAVAVCFDAPIVELLDSRAVAIHPAIAALGPDLLAPDPDLEEAVRRLLHPSRARLPIGEALLDQKALAGLGNVYRSEICFVERIDPFQPVGSLSVDTLRRLTMTAARLIGANRLEPERATMPDALGAQPGNVALRRTGPRMWVYGRAGRPCRRCGTPISSVVTGDLARRCWWCPTCQPAELPLPPGGIAQEAPQPAEDR